MAYKRAVCNATPLPDQSWTFLFNIEQIDVERHCSYIVWEVEENHSLCAGGIRSPVLRWIDFRLSLLPGLLWLFGSGGKFLLCRGRTWLSHYEGQGGEEGGEVRARDWDKFPFVYTYKEVQGRLYVVARGSLEWLHRSCRVTLRLSYG